VGNGETVALVSPGLGIDWLCAPRADSFPVYARALDPQRGGSLSLHWGWEGGPDLTTEQVRQRYRGRTCILETVAAADGLAIAVTDYMPWGRRCLVREIALTNRSGASRRVRVGFSSCATRSAAAPPDLHGPLRVAFRGETSALLAPGEALRTHLVAAYGADPAEAEANWRAARVDDMAEVESFWQRWLAPARPVRSGDPALDEAYWRGLLTLKLLCQERSGAILAAPTASFPAVPGGGDNWDYRFCWLRDGYFIARCLDAAGLHTESRRFYDLVLRFQGPDGRWRQTLYTVDGGNPVEFEAPDLTGPNGERPVRFGNAASTQIQIDSEPSVLHGLWCHWRATGDDAFIRDRWAQIRRAADAVMATWQWKENGIWEIRERIDHWVYGKSLSAAGLKAAAAMAAALGHGEEAGRWEREAERVGADVVENGWSEERQAYLQTYDKRSPLDISALALSLWDLLPAEHPRLQATVSAMEEPHRLPELPAERSYSTDTPFWGLRAGGLNMWGAMARYDYARVPFYLPTLWMARHYLRAGAPDRALGLVRLCLQSATDLGLMAEHFDPRSAGQWGNFPQGFSHEETVLALLELFGEPAY
jgi:alpha,alpha-trehalase